MQKVEKGVSVDKFQGVVLSTDLVPSTSSRNILVSDINTPSIEVCRYLQKFFGMLKLISEATNSFILLCRLVKKVLQ